MFHYYIPKSVEDYPCAIDDDLYAHEFLQEIADPHKRQATELDDIIVHLAHDSDLYAMSASGMDYQGQYFGDENLYEYSDDEYDYPRGIEDDDHSYARDPDLRAIFEDDADILVSHRDKRRNVDSKELELDSEVSEDMRMRMLLEDELFDARYFHPTDLYEKGDFGVPVFHESEADGSVSDSFDGPLQMAKKRPTASSNPRYSFSLRQRDFFDEVDQVTWLC